MKKPLIFSALLCLSLITMAQPCQVKNSSYDGIRIKFSTPVPNVNETNILKEGFTNLTLQGFTAQTVAGQPALPELVKIIEVPLGDGLKYTVESMQCDTIDGATIGIKRAIIPAQPSRRKSDTSPLTIVKDNAVYTTNAFCGAPTIELESIGIARNRNLATVKFNPMRWNPVTNQLIVVKEITVNIEQTNADIAATKHMQQLYASPAFNSSANVINCLGSKDNHTNAPLRYTIVAHSMFRGALDDFAAWKTRKGFIVDLVYTDDANVGSSSSSIKNYLQGLYDNATTESPAPTYVLFVGDIAQIPAFSLSSYDGPHSSDLSYCCWTGNDNIPDCYYGRFSAQNLTQLTPQISKTLMYEQYTFPDPSYLSTAALVAGVDGGYSSDNGYRYGDPAMDYVAKTYITANNGFTNIVYYKNNTSFAPAGVTVTGSSQSSSTAAILKNLYNSGCGFVNYTAHGGETSWSNPGFSNSDVSQMTNNNKPIVMIGNCCLTNSYQVDACFGEALLRKNDNAGAVGYIGGSNSTYWTEDFYWTVGIRSNINNTMDPSYDATHLGMYDKWFHSHNEDYSKYYLTMGAMIYAGNMAVEASSSNAQMKLYYWQIYHLMGDPSLMPYYHGQATTITANIPEALPIGSSSVNISTVPYAYIGFTDEDNNLLGAAFADANGNATLSFQPLSTPGEYVVVITAQGYRPLTQTVNIISNGPYVSCVEMTPRTELEANSNISFDIKLRNLGINDAGNITIEFQNPDGSILIDTTGIIDLSTGLASGQELTLNNVCTGHIWGQTADQTNAAIKVLVRWGNTVNDISTNTYYFTVNADLVKMQSYSIDSSNIRTNGTATITITNHNYGHASLANATVSLISLDPAFDVTTSNLTINNLQPGHNIQNSFNISANGNIPNDHAIMFIQSINSGFKTIKDTIFILFGYDNSFITFEDNTWGNSEWVHGDYPWQIVNQGAYSGSRCARSYAFSNNEGSNKQSELSITWTSSVDDSISFFKNVSSEGSYDFFRFYIDGDAKEEMSGTSNEWSRSAYFVPAGTHTFKFSYEKDYSVSRGSDCAWIDNLHLPLSGSNYIYIIDSICQGSEYQFRDLTINTAGFEAGVYHYVDSSDASIYYLTLVLTSAPEVTINGGNVTIRKGETVRLTAEGAESYLWDSGETSAIIDVYPTETTTYTVTGYNGNCSSTASTTITVEGTIGIDNSRLNVSNITIYPNPAHDKLTISGVSTSHITIIDVTGKVIIDKAAEGSINTVDISRLNSGIYFIQVTDNNWNKTTLKFIKKQ